MERGTRRIPLFPIIPFVFPLAFGLTMLCLTAWFSYKNWKELTAIREVEEGMIDEEDVLG